jgi:RNA polymerase sigma-70 factor, ECF subfamily
MTFDEALTAAQTGDEAAFAILWRALHPALLRYLRVLAPEAAEDIGSECWLQVMRSLRRFKGDEAGFKAWLFTIARNKVTDWRRHEKRRPTDPLEDRVADETMAVDDTEDAVLARIGTEAALRLIAELPPDQAEIIMLRVVAAMDVADVARIVHKSPGAVRVTSHRALRRLRDALAHSGDLGETAEAAVTQ